MRRVLHVYLLWVFQVMVSITQVHGLTCFRCDDVASPEHCRDRTICGNGEMCLTEEYTNGNGKQAFRLGCEKQAQCTIYQDGLKLFGKRDVLHLFPSDKCYNCCSSDDCNTALCTAAVTTHPVTTSTPAPPLTQCNNSNGMVCFNCNGVTSPLHCRETTVCGQGEICSIAEYQDNSGRQAFRLGCQHEARCQLFLNARTLIGKRDVSGPAPPPECYQCCAADRCNADQCIGAVLSNPQPTSSSVSTCSCNTANVTTTRCPEKFIEYKDYCYQFPPGGAYHYEARSYCERKGAQLLSIHSQDEHNFLIQEINKYNASYISGFWTGAYYSHPQQDWAWFDGSPFNYTPFIHNHRQSIYNYSVDYFAVLSNPAYSSLYKDAPLWYPTIDTDTYAVVCKIHV